MLFSGQTPAPAGKSRKVGSFLFFWPGWAVGESACKRFALVLLSCVPVFGIVWRKNGGAKAGCFCFARAGLIHEPPKNNAASAPFVRFPHIHKERRPSQAMEAKLIP